MPEPFEEVYRRFLEDPEGFWGDAARAVDWYRPWDRVLDASRPPFHRWFSGGVSTPAITPWTGTWRTGTATGSP
ncbi:MAG: hypothetical protein LUQ41_05845 [Methanomicrobiales archaeon]|nr:hypothetical protein [Methanomicrobiales archaeon]